MQSANPGVPTDPGASPPAVELRAQSAREDADCIGQTLRGDSAAFGRLVEKYQDRLYNSLCRYVGSAEDARDITQEAFVQAYVKLSTYKHNSAFFTWLYRIAFNRAASAGRKRRERSSLDALAAAGAPDPVDQQRQPEEAMIAQERLALVRQAVAELADDYRQVVVLREFDGFDYQQIAETLEIPIGTVRSRLFRARLQMKERLAPMIVEDTTPQEPTAGRDDAK